MRSGWCLINLGKVINPTFMEKMSIGLSQVLLPIFVIFIVLAVVVVVFLLLDLVVVVRILLYNEAERKDHTSSGLKISRY